MSRVARRIRMASLMHADARFDPEQHFLESAFRSRTARKVRAHLRRMEPVIIFSPRWGGVGGFLEDLALDLAVGEPAIGCRTVSFRPLKGRTLGEAWQFTLHIFGQLGRRGWTHRHPTMVADRRGFRYSLRRLLEDAHRTAPHRVALLAHGAEHLPVELVEDLTICWREYQAEHPEGRRCTVLLAGSMAERHIVLDSAARLDLEDYGEAEAAAAIIGQAGPVPIERLERVAHFTGGIPGLVDAVGSAPDLLRALPADGEELLARVGRIGDDLRGAVDIVAAHSDLADRLHELRDGQPRPGDSSVDHPLQLAGLVRPVRGHGAQLVALRAPAIGALLD